MKIIILLLSMSILLGNQSYEKIDILQENNEFEESLELSLETLLSNDNDVEILWRVARGYFDVSDQTTDEKIKKNNIDKGLPYAAKALELNPESAKANHWYAVMFGKKGELEGTKQKILNSYDMKKFCMKAIEIDPNYDGSLHVMGRWHYGVADLSWFERSVASLVYATPPTGSFNEAVSFFDRAKEANPNDIRHYLWLGKSYIAIGEKQKAEQILKKSLELTIFTDSDRILKQEVQDLLKRL